MLWNYFHGRPSFCGFGKTIPGPQKKSKKQLIFWPEDGTIQICVGVLWNTPCPRSRAGRQNLRMKFGGGVWFAEY
jgi:hypothetical protein